MSKNHRIHLKDDSGREISYGFNHVANIDHRGHHSKINLRQDAPKDAPQDSLQTSFDLTLSQDMVHEMVQMAEHCNADLDLRNFCVTPRPPTNDM